MIPYPQQINHWICIKTLEVCPMLQNHIEKSMYRLTRIQVLPDFSAGSLLQWSKVWLQKLFCAMQISNWVDICLQPMTNLPYPLAIPHKWHISQVEAEQLPFSFLSRMLSPWSCLHPSFHSWPVVGRSAPPVLCGNRRPWHRNPQIGAHRLSPDWKRTSQKKNLDRKVRSHPGSFIVLYKFEAVTVSCLLGNISAEFEGVTNPELGLCHQVTLRALTLSVGTDG